MTQDAPSTFHVHVRALAAQLASAPTWWEFDNILREIVLARDRMKHPKSRLNRKRFVEDES